MLFCITPFLVYGHIFRNAFRA